MNICVFCSCSPVSAEYEAAVRQLGRVLGEGGNTLIFGAFNEGLMGAIADGFADVGAPIVGVAPKVLVDAGRASHPGCKRVLETISLAERKAAMIELSDAIVAAPGGIGTLDEVFSVLAMDITGELELPVAFYNLDGFFSGIYAELRKMEDTGFIRTSIENLVHLANTPEEVLECVQKPVDFMSDIELTRG